MNCVQLLSFFFYLDRDFAIAEVVEDNARKGISKKLIEDALLTRSSLLSTCPTDEVAQPIN